MLTLEEFKEDLKERIRKEAITSSCFSHSSKQIDYKCIVELMDVNGETLEEYEFDDRTAAVKKMSELTEDIFNKGKEEELYVCYDQSERYTGGWYDADLMIEYREKEIKNYERTLENQKIAEEKKQQRFARWKQATEWAISMGVKLSPNYNTRQKTISQVVRNGLEDDWNEKYPEFEISQHDILWYRRYWNDKAERSGKK